MRKAFCTISTLSHLFKAKALFHSLWEAGTDADFFCLITDEKESIRKTERIPSLKNAREGGESFQVCFHSHVFLKNEGEKLPPARYSADRKRWASKPMYMQYLLKKGYDRVVYLDNDIFFFSSPEVIFIHLEKHDFLVTPHRYPFRPYPQPAWFEANFQVGLYNAGFVAGRPEAADAISWWKECCFYTIKRTYWRGLFEDQKYLDLMPVLFPNVGILHHKGCNLAGWNFDTVQISLKDGKVLLDETYPVVFMHFAPVTFRRILGGDVPALRPLADRYLQVLNFYNPAYRVRSDTKLNRHDWFTFFRYIWWRFCRLWEQ